MTSGRGFTWCALKRKKEMDALYAHLLGMGFEMDQIEQCQSALALSSAPFNLQAATEW